MKFFARSFLLLCILFVSSSSYCQYSSELNLLKTYLNEGKNEKALQGLQKIQPSSLSIQDKAYYNLLMALCHEQMNNEHIAFEYYLKARDLYGKADSLTKVHDINIDIVYLKAAQENIQGNDQKLHKKYLEDFLMHSQKIKDTTRIAKGYSHLALFNADQNNLTESVKLYIKALSLAKNINNKLLESSIRNNLAVLYSESLQKPDSALYHLKIDLINIRDFGEVEDLMYNYMNQAAAYHHLKKYQKAIDYLHLALNLPIKKYRAKTHQYLYEFLYKNYEALGDHTNAYKYLLLTTKLADSIKGEEQNIAINDIQTKYQTKEKELENTKLKSKIETNRILMYSSIGILIAVASIAFLIIKNARRKEKISKQEKLIEQQKLEKALKDYELNSIDMMLEGQEKERQRIANDLHDNLGSMLATLKLNFENLKLRKSELRDEENKLYERTDELIEEAYQKVRRLAHAKNAGVFATEGLIPAIKKLAEKISIPGKLQIQVVPFGFNDRLENALEIAIFRAIQELSTNIIKHSQATEATIHLTHHDDNINIIIQDNGVGFKSIETQSADGMGLQTIRKKIEQLGGTFNIDSTLGKGTTIIIDIPV